MRLLRCAAKVLTTTFALYVELAEAAGRHSATDQSLARLQQLGDKHLGGEAARAVGVHYAVLELEQGASKRDVHKAYKAMSLNHHPDKRPGADCAMQQRVGNAKAELEQDSVRLRFVRMLALPFCLDVIGREGGAQAAAQARQPPTRRARVRAGALDTEA